MRLYGEKFEIAGEPIVVNDNEVLVDAIEVKSGKVKRMTSVCEYRCQS
jgi:hypothetical protein